MSAVLVDYRVAHGIAIFELNNPPANTYTYEMMRALDECILQARFDPEVAVLVLRGKGERFFSAGADIQTATIRAIIDRLGGALTSQRGKTSHRVAVTQ